VFKILCCYSCTINKFRTSLNQLDKRYGIHINSRPAIVISSEDRVVLICCVVYWKASQQRSRFLLSVNCLRNKVRDVELNQKYPNINCCRVLVEILNVLESFPFGFFVTDPGRYRQPV
jgi:hypothetical protein